LAKELVALQPDLILFFVWHPLPHARSNKRPRRSRLYSWAIVPTGLVLSLLAVVLLLFTGWKGGEMVYRHRVGILEHPQARQTPMGPPPRRAA